jgi:hypothetical protein
MMIDRTQIFQRMLLAGFLASSTLSYSAVTGVAQTTASPGEAQRTMSSPAPSTARAPLTSATQTVSSERGAMMYRRIWGIDNLKLEPIASGSLIRFSYRVVDARKAQVLNDKKKDPYLLLEKSGAKLGVEQAERVGKLRQTAEPESGREYWMVFGNSRHLVQPGDRVDIVIGTFHAHGLFVESPQAAVVGKR